MFNIYPGLDFFYVIFWYFFLLLLWSIICHQLFLLLVTFIFGPMGKMATCLTPGIRDFGHWFWKIGRDVHNLQPLNGLIKKKKKLWPISNGAQLCDWLRALMKGLFLQFVLRSIFSAFHKNFINVRLVEPHVNKVIAKYRKI